MFKLDVNGQQVTVDCSEDTPLLWVLRDHLRLTGTKFGCGIGQCGACTVHIDSQPVRACMIPIEKAQGRNVRTIESLKRDDNFSVVQTAWLEEDVAQCGYCQSGQIMAATALLENNPDPDEEAINEAMLGHICRCGTYPRIRLAIKRASHQLSRGES
ncbi:MAG: (2Fe-2S)-binding protein [Gammaproteobacteria bacterium]|nr:(2Fe-2S)-binding protein [Gammaproteobacteria bacterium]